jgi:hypothetical protein
MKAAEIPSKVAFGFGDDAYTLVSVHYWPHEFKIGRVSTRDDSRLENAPMGDADATILKRSLKIPLSSLQTLNKDLHIPRVMVWEQMTKSFGLPCHNFKRV